MVWKILVIILCIASILSAYWISNCLKVLDIVIDIIKIQDAQINELKEINLNGKNNND